MRTRFTFGLAITLSFLLVANPLLALASGKNDRLAIGPRDKKEPELAKTIPPASANKSRRIPRVVRLETPALLPGQSATLLPDGRWLLLGGEGEKGLLSTATIKDARTGESAPITGSLREPRAWHSATMLPDGTVLIYGGIGHAGQVLSSAESFNPDTQRFEALPPPGLAPRAHHTATLLTNGQLLIVGGTNRAGRVFGKAELWDSRTRTVVTLGPEFLTARRKHSAMLLPDGSVLLLGGKNSNDESIDSGEVYDPESQSFSMVGGFAAQEDTSSPYLMASLPKGGDTNVAKDTRIALRFSKPLRAETINAEKLVLNGPHGAVQTKIVPAEGGMLAFISPLEPLHPGTTYTLTINGSTDVGNLAIAPASVTFTTETAPPASNNQPADAMDGMDGMMPGHDTMRPSDAVLTGNKNQPFDPEEWKPSADNFKGNWETKAKESPLQKMEALKAAAGETALAGQVLTLTGEALANVMIHVGNRMAKTDATGRFLIKNVAGGRHPFVINGSTASTPTKPYGTFEGLVNIKEGQTNVLPYTVWLPIIETRYATKIAAPTPREIVATTPLIPGLEIHIPAGVHVKYPNGEPFTNLTITPIPTNRSPLPLPGGVTPRLLFSLQMHGAKTQRADGKKAPGLRIVYPNYGGLKPGAHVPLWDYDAEKGGWYVYGEGTVTKDGRQVVPDPGVELPGMHCYGGFFDNIPPWWIAPGWHLIAMFGDPVDLSSGLFLYNKTDLALPDTMPVALSRSYRQGDTAAHAFGVGTNHPYEMTISGDNPTQTYGELILPDGKRVKYDRTNPGSNPMTFEHTSTPTVFYKSTLTYVQGGRGLDGVSNGWDIKLSDGTVYQFFIQSRGIWIHSADVKLEAIIDRHGNRLTIARDQLLRITRVTSPNGRWIDFSYDTDPSYLYRITQAKDNIGRTVTYTYDGSNRLWKVTDPKGGVTEHTYDGSARMLTIKDPRGLTFLTNEYDGNGRVSKQTLTDSSTFLFSYTLDTNGKVTQTDATDPRGKVRRLTFNADGFPLTETDAVGEPEEQTYTYVRQAGTNRLSSATDPLGRKTTFAYNSFGKVTSVTRLADTSGAVTASVTYESTYNQVASITDPLNHTTSFAYDSKGNLTSATNALNHQVTFTYNAAGQPLTATDALNNTSQFIYEGSDLVELKDPLGRSLTRFIDGAGRVAGITNPVGQTVRLEYDNLNQMTRATDPSQAATVSAYNANGYLESFTDQRGSVTSYIYNNMDRVTTRRDPLSHDTTYVYDANGNLTQATDRKGQVTSFTYDALNRLKQVTYNDQSTTTYTYDAVSRLTQIVDSVSGTITYAYDNLDRLTSETTPQGTVSYTYDAAGRCTSMTAGGQTAVSYTYDNANRLTGITQGSSTVTFNYDAAGRRTSLTLPNGMVTEYGYDAASQLTSITYKQGATVLGDLTYEYNQAGLRTKIGGSFAATLLPQVLSSANYNAANQQTSFASQTLTYDLNGNLTNDGTNTYAWDARGQLVSMSGTGLSASFQYDAVGRRTSKTVNGVTTGYLYNGANVVQEQAGGSPSVNFLNGGVDEVFARTDSAGTRNPLRDGLGSTLALTDSTGTVQSQYTYDPFGTTTASGSSSSNSAQYTGRENDQTGLYYYRARYYSPKLQRFISEDPIGFSGGVNFYAYVSNNPISFSDPSGLKPIESLMGGISNITGGFAHKLGGTGLGYGPNHYDTIMSWTPGAKVVDKNSWGFAFGGFLGDLWLGAFGGAVAAGAGGGGGAVAAGAGAGGGGAAVGAAEGAAIKAPIEYTAPGEAFVRVGARPQNLKFTFETPGGVQPGTHAFPLSTFNEIGSNPAALQNLGDLPGAAPQYYRILQPPPGTPIQRGIVQGGQYGGQGGVPEVYFPSGW